MPEALSLHSAIHSLMLLTHLEKGLSLHLCRSLRQITLLWHGTSQHLGGKEGQLHPLRSSVSPEWAEAAQKCEKTQKLDQKLKQLSTIVLSISLSTELLFFAHTVSNLFGRQRQTYVNQWWHRRVQWQPLQYLSLHQTSKTDHWSSHLGENSWTFLLNSLA